MAIYYGFSDLEDVAREFGGYNWETREVSTPSELFPTENEVLFALYATPAWEGYAFVLFRKDGELYEVHGSHCSCYGLEDQWSPERTSVDYLQKMIDEDRRPWYDDGEYGQVAWDDFVEVVKSL